MEHLILYLLLLYFFMQSVSKEYLDSIFVFLYSNVCFQFCMFIYTKCNTIYYCSFFYSSPFFRISMTLAISIFILLCGYATAQFPYFGKCPSPDVQPDFDMKRVSWSTVILNCVLRILNEIITTLPKILLQPQLFDSNIITK